MSNDCVIPDRIKKCDDYFENEYFKYREYLLKRKYLTNGSPQNPIFTESEPDHSIYVPNDVRQFMLPVFQHYGNRSFHTVLAEANWDLKNLVNEHADKILRSEREASKLLHKKRRVEWDSILLRWDRDVFLLCRNNIRVFAPTLDRADQVLNELVARYGRKREKTQTIPSFFILNVRACEVDTEEISIKRHFVHRPEDLAIHYGNDFVPWEREFVKRLTSVASGVSVFRGPPGTGKTSFLRHLIAKLRNRCIFYYLPTTQYPLLTNVQMVSFWVSQNRRYEKYHKVIILEDAEQLLMTRANDNRDQVSNLLNLSDGLLGEFFNMHLLCTINCQVDELDPAVLRAGRMVTYREFPRLSVEQAQRLASKLGKSLPEQADYSLAEIYFQGSNGAEQTQQKQKIGFGGSS